MSTTYGNMIASDTEFDIRQMIAEIRRLKRQHKEWQDGTRVAVRQIEPCRVCGQRIDFETDPCDRYVMCRCMLEELKRQYQLVADPRSVVPSTLFVTGIRVDVK